MERRNIIKGLLAIFAPFLVPEESQGAQPKSSLERLEHAYPGVTEQLNGKPLGE